MSDDELVAWLVAQLDAHEKVAQAALEPWHRSVRRQGTQWPKRTDVTDEDAALLAFHNAYHNPAVVLRDIAAKRAILALHAPTRYTNRDLGIVDAAVCITCHAVVDSPETWDEDEKEWPYPSVQRPYPCPTVGALASAYAHEPGYREEWKP